MNNSYQIKQQVLNKKKAHFKRKKLKTKTNIVLKSLNSIKKTENKKIIRLSPFK